MVNWKINCNIDVADRITRHMSHGVAVVTSWFLFAFFPVYYPCRAFGLEVTMNKKHLTYDDRLAIQAGLQQGLKVAQIAKNMSSAVWISYSSSSWWIMLRFPSVICTLCTGFFSLAIIKGLLMIKYFTIEDLLKHYLQKKFHILAKRQNLFVKSLKI